MKKYAEEKEYLESVIDMTSNAEVLTQLFINPFDQRREEAHEALCKKYGIGHRDIDFITNHLDIAIGFEYLKKHSDYTEEEINALSEKLANVIAYTLSQMEKARKQERK